jgi:hypothetical protein
VGWGGTKVRGYQTYHATYILRHYVMIMIRYYRCRSKHSSYYSHKCRLYNISNMQNHIIFTSHSPWGEIRPVAIQGTFTDARTVVEMVLLGLFY